jgi:hypothetical protein
LFAGSGGKNLPAWPQKNATFYHAFSNGHFYHNFAWPLTEKTMTHLLQEVLRKRFGERMVPLRIALETWEGLKNDNPTVPPSLVAKKTGEALQAQYVVLGNVWRFKERKGTAISSEGQASVAFTIYILNVENGNIVWRATFEKTQQALSDNVLAASDFFKQGARWLTAEELARFGIKHILKKFPIR